MQLKFLKPISLLLLLLPTYYLFSQTSELQCQLIDKEANTNENFGESVAIYGEYAVIGTPKKSNIGAAFVYKLSENGWILHSKLIPPPKDTIANFGTSVAIYGKYVIVGASTGNDAVYVYELKENKWVQQTKLVTPNSSSSTNNGKVIDIYNDKIAIGTNKDPENGKSSGAVYVYQKEDKNWIFKEKLMASNGSSMDLFGSSIAIYDNYIAVGAPQFKPKNINQGSAFGTVYMFKYENSGWIETAHLLCNNPESNSKFGYSVALNQNHLVVGTPYERGVRMPSGVAYVFEKKNDNWTQSERLIGNENYAENFGWSVAISDNSTIIIGAINGLNRKKRTGVAYIYDQTMRKVIIKDVQAKYGNNFGNSVSIFDSHFIIGANKFHTGKSGAGKALIYKYN